MMYAGSVMSRSTSRAPAAVDRPGSSCTEGPNTYRQPEVTQRFLAAAMGGDLDELMMVLAPDVTLITDGGGKVKAALRPITGAAKVARGLPAAAGRRYMEIGASGLTIEAAEIHGGPGMLVTAGGEPIVAVATVVADERITAIYVVANPDKLR